MTDMFTYKFWGIRADGRRDFIGMVKAPGMSDAIESVSSILRNAPMHDYPGLEIERVDLLRLRSDVQGATHVQLQDGRVQKIASKWGIDENGHLAKPSEGGFGTVTESGERVDMLSARGYWKIIS